MTTADKLALSLAVGLVLALAIATYLNTWRTRRDVARVGQIVDALRDAREASELDDAIALALADLVLRCDGDEGVRPDGSNVDTRRAHAALEAAGWRRL